VGATHFICWQAGGAAGTATDRSKNDAATGSYLMYDVYIEVQYRGGRRKKNNVLYEECALDYMISYWEEEEEVS
jgi:hypothetical protein